MGVFSRIAGLVNRGRSAIAGLFTRPRFDPTAPITAKPIKFKGGVQVKQPGGIPTPSANGQVTPEQKQLEEFLYFEMWLPVVSSNVAAAQYQGGENKLTLEFLNGNFYQYSNVSTDEARSLALAGSKGGWVWDEFRVRGTVYGYKKPYIFLSGPSRSAPRWHGTEHTRQKHGEIGPAGESIFGHIPGTGIFQRRGK